MAHISTQRMVIIEICPLTQHRASFEARRPHPSIPSSVFFQPPIPCGFIAFQGFNWEPFWGSGSEEAREQWFFLYPSFPRSLRPKERKKHVGYISLLPLDPEQMLTSYSARRWPQSLSQHSAPGDQ